MLCTNATSVSISLAWNATPATDIYYVALSENLRSISQPYAIRTSATSNLDLIDLKPHTDYWLQVYSHPANDSIVWGWAPSSAATLCSTTATRAGAPHSLRREGDLASDSMALSWSAAEALGEDQTFEVMYWPEDHSPGRGIEKATSRTTELSVRDLRPATTYMVAVRSSTTGATSDPVPFRTAQVGVNYTMTYRISEYQFTPDFLDNHDSASVDAIPVYIMDHNPITTGSISPDWGRCARQLPGILGPEQHGAGLSCLRFADKQKRAEVTAACGNFSTADNNVGWDVHWYCGTGWPESVVMSSPITEYCVEHLPAPEVPKHEAVGGWASYLSCNGDEVDPWGNAPKDPMCICNVWMDRMIAQTPRSIIEQRCGLKGQPGTAYDQWVNNEVQCNCSADPRGGVFLEPDDPANTFVGRAPVALPYLWYVRNATEDAFARDPLEDYPVTIPSGHNYVTPRAGSCREGERPGGASAMGQPGCTWKRTPGSRVFWGGDLVAAGWNFTFVQDTPTDVRHTQRNKQVFKEVVSAPDLSTASKFVTSRCCGC
jgi:hypothetical protein